MLGANLVNLFLKLSSSSSILAALGLVVLVIVPGSIPTKTSPISNSSNISFLLEITNLKYDLSENLIRMRIGHWLGNHETKAISYLVIFGINIRQSCWF